MCLFLTHSTKPTRLEEFEQAQVAACDSVANHLRDNWAVSLKNIIKASALTLDTVPQQWPALVISKCCLA